MIQTIVLIENGKYPFGEVVSYKKSVKVQEICTYPSLEQLRQNKSKMQNLFKSTDNGSQTTVSSRENCHIIKLIKIYQQDLTLHFIYEYVPHSVNQFIKTKLYADIDLQKSHILQINSKLFLKKVCYQLGTITNFLIRRKVKTNLDYDLLGIDDEENLKFFVDPACEILYPEINNKDKQSASFQSQQSENELRNFYEQKKQIILFRLEDQFRKMRKAEHNIPNFIIKGNQLIFSKPIDSQSQPSYSPSPSNFTESSFTERCESVDGNFLAESNDNVRKTHGNLFAKLKKTQSYNYNTESNKKLQQNMLKLDNLRKKSKKLNQQLKQNYLSSSQCFTPNSNVKESNEFQKRGSTQFQPIYAKNNQTQRQMQRQRQQERQKQEEWRNSQIPEQLRKTHLPQGSTGKSPNRFGGFLDGRRSKSNRNHKSSFQFKPPKERDWFNPNKSFDKGFRDEFQDNSYQKSKSIRIQVQQSTTGNKQRKNSFKVKILTCQQMQMDGENMEQFVFNAMNKNFNQPQNNAEDDEQQSEPSECGKKSSRSHTSNYSERFKNVFSQKFKNDQRDEDVNTKFSESPVKQHVRQRERQSSSQKNIFQKYNEQFGNEKEKSTKNPQLEQKIKMAKQKAEEVLNKYLKLKKFSSKNTKY